MSLSRTWTRGMGGQILNVPCTDSIILDFSLSNFWKIDVDKNFILKNPINMIPGQSGTIILNITNPSIITYDTYFKWEDGMKSVLDSNTLNLLTFFVLDNNKIICSVIKNVDPPEENMIIHEITPTNATAVKMNVNCTDVSIPAEWK